MPQKRKVLNRNNAAISTLDSKARDAQIVELCLQGHSMESIATELGITETQVQKRVDRLLIEYSNLLQAKVEALGAREFARLEYLYEQVLPYALARKEGEVTIPPDPRLLGSILKIMAEKREWVKLAHSTRPKDAGEGTVYNIDNIEVTFSSSNELYKRAVIDMANNPDWLSAADMPVDALFLPPVTVEDVEGALKELEKDDEGGE